MSRRISNDATLVADQLHSAAIHLLRKLRREDSASGLNAARFSALSVIVFAGPVTLGGLAAAEQVRPPTMTRIVDALVQQGLAEREKNELDGRSTFIHATADGRKLLSQGRDRRVRVLAERITTLHRSDRNALKEASGILTRLISEI